MRGQDDIDPGERARDYLICARRCADLVNGAYLPNIEKTPGTDKDFIVQVAIMNAVMAIAEATVPLPPGMRLA